MNDEEVFHKIHALAVLLIIRIKDVLDLRRQVELAAVQRVMESLGDFVKVIAAGDHVPACGNFQLIHERNQAIQNFRHATTHGG